jgi:hypothetical protein
MRWTRASNPILHLALRPLLAALVAQLATAAAVDAQVVGAVVDATGKPVAGADVELWAPGIRLASTITSRDGRFAFQSMAPTDATTVYASHVGYLSATELIRSRDTLVVTLERTPIVLPAISVHVPRAECGESDNGAARELWQQARQHYATDTTERSIQARLQTNTRVVPAAQVGVVDVSMTGMAVRGSSARFIALWRELFTTGRYVRALPEGDLSGVYGDWRYPPLEAELAIHFVEDLFGELHRFGRPVFSGTGWRVPFCPASISLAGITGVFRLGIDSHIESIEWRYDDTETKERAGGRVVFPAPAQSFATVALLPIEGLFWRERFPDTFVQVYSRFDEWLLTDGPLQPMKP